MDTDQRNAHLRRIARLGGLATYAKYGSAYYSHIGKLGFRVTLELGWGPWLRTRLAASYEAKFGTPLPAPPLSPSERAQFEQLRADAAVRAAARRAHPRRSLGGCQWPGCRRHAQEIHHLRGVRAAGANAPENLRFLCTDHHRLVHVLLRQRKRVPL